MRLTEALETDKESKWSTVELKRCITPAMYCDSTLVNVEFVNVKESGKSE